MKRTLTLTTLAWGQPMIDKLKALTDKPVATIINSHAHFDHVNGNAEFPATVDIVTSEQTKTLMEDFHPVTDRDDPGRFE